VADGLVLYLFWGSDGDGAVDDAGDKTTPSRTLLRLALTSSEEHDASQPAGTILSADHDSKLLGISADEVAAHTKYLAVLATIRLVLLSFPLSYAAYSGARVPCVIAQYIFHGVCGMVVVSHMLAVLVLNPTGFEDHGETVNPIDGLVPVKDGDGMTGDAWTLLSLSLIAILLHFLIVLHVRSTGGQLQDGYEERRERRKRLAYSSSNLVALGRDNEMALDGVRMNDQLLLPNSSGTLTMKERFMCLPDQYGAFVMETQSRFDAARRMWLERLEMLRQGDPNNSSHGDGRLNSDADFVPSPTRNSESTNLIANAINSAATNASRLIQRPDPFKVLLQLFAYEDVWSNNRLELAFSIATSGEIDKPAQECAALSFYAPQLLSFLLHGAYFDVSQKLEKWILQKCNEDFHFAHRCFWFLRAWCMGDDSIQSSTNDNLIGFEKNLYTARHKRSSSRHSLDPPTAWNEYSEAAGSMDARGAAKFAPDEEVMIRELMARVIQKGGRPASLAHYGSIDPVEGGCDELQFASSPSEIATAVENGFVPVDPRTGFSSTKHIDVISSTRKHGFLPLTSSGAPCETTDSDTASLFFACPLFLDALLSIADDLMEVPIKTARTPELRRRLRSLEVELLPSNVVYLPIQSMRHRVWRIVADESIALSTNERVPCIIALEIIDEQAQNLSGDIQNERSIVSSWVRAERPARRHTTILDKFAFGLKRLDAIHVESKKGMIDRKLSDLLPLSEGPWNKSAPLYSKIGSRNEDEDHTGEENIENQENNWSELDELQATRDNRWAPISPPPLGSPRVAAHQHDEVSRGNPRTPPVRRYRDAVTGNESPMGQWTPTLGTSRRTLRVNFEEDCPQELGDEDSTQGKQRQSLTYSPESNTSYSDHDNAENEDPIDRDPESRDPKEQPAVVFKENWQEKESRLKIKSIWGNHPGWRLLPILIKSNDDLRQEQLASQLIQRMALILARAKTPVWLYPYEIVALSSRGGIIEAVPDTISLDSLKRNDPNFSTLKAFFEQHFGVPGTDSLASAKANFVESLAAYSMVSFLMQIKDRHNGNILLDNKGHIIHIDFGFYFLSSPGKNSGFESAPFKLTRDFVRLLDGPDSFLFQRYRDLCYKTFLELRKHCFQITLLIEMLMEGNEDLACFRGQPEEAVRQMQQRFRLDLNDNGVRKYVDSLINESVENWRTRWYDRYQRFCVGVM